MISRLSRTAQTFAVVLLAYFAYAMIAAPLIEPEIEVVHAKWEPLSRSGVSATDLTLFPEGAWERGEPKVLETNQGTLLFDDYQQLENGDLRLPRCTLISYIDPPTDDGESGSSAAATGVPSGRSALPQTKRRPVVLRASEGAILSFDPPPNFMLGEFGRLVGGQLRGEITIVSRASNAAADDALSITTKNVQIDQQRIWAPSQVEFRFGRNQARGRDLSIHFESVGQRMAGKQAAMGRIRSLELVHVDEVNLQLEGNLFAMVTGEKPSDGPLREPANQPTAAPLPTPIEIKCQGPFRFDFDALIASLEERVDVLRHNPDGPSDQLNCELLEIHLMPKATGPLVPPADAEDPPRGRPGAMQPKKIIAVGFPVMIRAPSMHAGARAKRMEYNFVTRRIELNGDEQATLFRDQFYVEAPTLEYELLEGGRLGRLQAAGPGLVRGRMGPEKRPFEATWGGSVSLLPQGHNKVLSLSGQANLTMNGFASLQARELHLYLLEVPRPKGDQVDIHIDRMQASGQIVLDSAQLIAHLAEAQLWFRDPTSAEIAAARQGGPATKRPGGLFGQQAGGDGKQPQKLQLTADVLRGQIILTETPQVEALDLQNNVHVNEFEPVGKSSLDIAAQRVVLERGNLPTAELTLTGAPARFSAEGMALDGTLIRVHLASNVAEVIGPGSMLMLPQHVALGANGQSKPLNVRWKQGMHFDGQTARFEGQIETRGGHVTKDRETIQFVAMGEILEVVLNRSIQFTAPETNGVDAVRLAFLGPAHMDSRTVDQGGIVTAVDSLDIRDLVINRQTGSIVGQGPGQIVHRGPNPQKKKPRTDGRRVPELIFLRVDFENEMVGNINQREIQFLNGTRTVLGPIDTWEQELDPQRPDLLGKHSVILTSRRLALVDMREAAGDEDAIEVEATGNSQIRGQQFTATGDRISYIRAKDQLVMEGVGRTKSTLKLQGQELSAGKILFYPETRQFALNDFEVELKDLGLSGQTQGEPRQVPTRQSPIGQPSGYPATLPQSGFPSNYRSTNQPNPSALPPQAARNQPTRSSN